jgi:DNA-binding transcriptional LysR family regulator
MHGKSGEMEIFVRTVAAGGFSAAARALKLTPSAISKLVARMEDRLGVQLIDRSTRSIRLTPEGEIYHRQCVRMLGEMDEVERTLSLRRSAPAGKLRVNSSVSIARQHIVPLLPEFLARHPAIELDLSLSDEVVDLIERRADVAIRISPLQDSTLLARKIFGFHRLVVASPDYLARAGVPEHPTDLARHNCLGFNFKDSLNQWPFDDGQGRYTVAVAGNLQADNGETLRQLALGGLGVARLATFMVGDDIREGRLVPLLEEHHPNDELAVFAIFFNQRHMAARVRCFIDFLTERLTPSLEQKARLWPRPTHLTSASSRPA